jgi:hypothetical protein
VSKKKKFDLSHLVHAGYVKEGQTLFYVSDPTKTCKVVKHPGGEFKVTVGAEMTTIHLFVAKCLGGEPPTHAANWVRNEKNETLFDIWHAEEDLAKAA